MFGKYLVAAITPFKASGQIDDGYFSLFFAVLNAHLVDTAVVFATNGEGPSMSLTEIDQSLRHIMDLRENMEILMGVFRTNINDTVKQLNLAEEYGVSGILLAPPFYFKNLAEEGLYQYFVKVMNKTSLPVVLYNIPKYTGVPLTVNLVNRLTEYSHFVGIKDSSGDISQTSHYIENLPDLSIYCGSDSLIYQSLQLGCEGFITALGNAFPGIIHEFLQNYTGNQHEKAKKDQEWLNEVRALVKSFPSIAAIKCCAERYLELPPTFTRPPLINLDIHQKEKLFQSLDVLISRRTS